MDTKLKSINRTLYYFIGLVILLATMFVTIFIISEVIVSSEEVLTIDEYLKSDHMVFELINAADDIAKVHKYYKDEEAIKSVDYSDFDEWDLTGRYSSMYDVFVEKNIKIQNEGQLKSYEKQPTIEDFKVAYDKELQPFYQDLIEKELKDYVRLKGLISKESGIYYLYKNNEFSFSNIDEYDAGFYENREVLYRFNREGEMVTVKLNGNRMVANKYLDLLNFEDNDELYVVFSDDYIKNAVKAWENESLNGRIAVSILLVEMVLFLMVLFLMIIHLRVTDLKYLNTKMYYDIFLMIMGSISIPFFAMLMESSYRIYYPLLAVTGLYLGLIIAITLVVTIKHYKEKTLIRHTLGYVILKFFVDSIYKFFSRLPVAVRMLPTVKNTNDFKKGLLALENIKNGDLDQNISPISRGLYGELVTNINAVKEGIRVAVSNEMKSERLKSELITNVSHDIRTPLTSIINYVDLLKSEEDDIKRKQYLEILDAKSQRLKVLIEDLFEAAKVSSGSIPIILEEVNLGSLLKQCLGEANDHIELNKLNVMMNCDPYSVLGDRNAMWRVIDNIISNITKYALEGSRVYIECNSNGEEVKLVFKNISAHPLNIPVDELMTRFKRGDESRHSEGSGLGLSIARDLVKIQKGQMELSIDGDLFKVTITMPVF